MKERISVIAIIFLIESLFGQESSLDKSYNEFVREVKHSVVSIRVRYLLGYRSNIGSGVIISPDGYVLTSAHVIAQTNPSFEINIVGQDQKYKDVKLIGDCSPVDVAILKINSQRKFTPMKIGNSDQLVKGSWVMAFGALSELGHIPLQGKVVKIGNLGLTKKIGRRTYKYGDMVMVDFRGRKGYSGSPLINREGELVGIMSLGFNVWEFKDLSMSIPVNNFKKKIDAFKKSKVSCGWLGVEVKDVDDYIADEYELEEESGVLVRRVVGRSPARKGGLRQDDVIIKIDNQKVTDAANLKEIIKNTQPDQEIKLIVIRDFEKEILTIKLGSIPDNIEMTDFRL